MALPLDGGEWKALGEHVGQEIFPFFFFLKYNLPHTLPFKRTICEMGRLGTLALFGDFPDGLI